MRHFPAFFLTVSLCLSVFATAPTSARAADDPYDAATANARTQEQILADWLLQDTLPGAPADPKESELRRIRKVLEDLRGLGEPTGKWEAEVARLHALPASDPAWREGYVRLCERRRELRLRTLREQFPRFVFAKHFYMSPSFYAYTEGQSDAQNERHFSPRTTLTLLEVQPDGTWLQRNLVADRNGVIRDPVATFDGRKVIFAWKKSLNEDDYHLYEYDLDTDAVRQLTSGLGFADYEPCVLPNGDILFSSTRCCQIVDCWWTEVSNLYRCDADGGNIRRVSFDQVHSTHPALMSDGRVIYTRWDYNDRGQVFPQPLFQMNMDGTAQTECYGNNSWFPTSIQHARGIPDSHRIVAVLAGHHTPQRGKLAIIDTTLGRQETSGIQLIAPEREATPDHIDAWGQDGDQFMHPYPLNEREFVVSYNPAPGGPRRWNGQFGIYYMDRDGNRELLAYDHRVGSMHPYAVRERKPVPERPSTVDESVDYGTFYMQDVYLGPGLEGVERGKAKTLRVLGLDFRTVGIGDNGNGGRAGGAMVCTPVSIGQGAWDVKILLGDAEIYPDGSACFRVPARQPVYFQVLDENGRCIQTMRSWSTLQPGENFACLGCHEDKNSGTALVGGNTEAMRRGPQELRPIYGPVRGFSFPKEIQPIFDRHCIRCHQNREKLPPFATGKLVTWAESAGWSAAGTQDSKPFSLLGDTFLDVRAKRNWSDSYLNLLSAPREERTSARNNGAVKWLPVQEAPPMLAPYFSGSSKSGLIKMFRADPPHNDVRLSEEELGKLALWIDLLVPYCGDYTEAAAWTDAEWAKYRYYTEKKRASSP